MSNKIPDDPHEWFGRSLRMLRLNQSTMHPLELEGRKDMHFGALSFCLVYLLQIAELPDDEAGMRINELEKKVAEYWELRN